MNVDPRPRSTRVALTVSTVTGQTLWRLSVSDLTIAELDLLLPRLTGLKAGEFEKFLEDHPNRKWAEHEVDVEL